MCPGTPARIELDDHFDLLEVLDRGGMSVVWRGRERRTRVDVAVKVLSARAAEKPDLAAIFTNEICTMARLDHRAIVQVHDHGRISARTRAEMVASGTRDVNLPTVGSPYLVMELMQGGTLTERAEALDWPGVRAVLLELLDALAHAHARGIIHRDLKPDNVLVRRTPDQRDSMHLADFGIARALEDVSAVVDLTAASGTPHYMAPEQAMGRWREQGPWTDLYGLGCLAWELVSGRTVFHDASASTERVLTSQVHAPLPAFEPRIDVPKSLERWLRLLLAKLPGDRPRCVADARRMLLRLGHAERSSRSTQPRFVIPPLARVDAPTVVEPRHQPARASTVPCGRPLPRVGRRHDRSATRESPGDEAGVSSVASSWRARPSRPAHPCAVRTRPSVFGLRPVPLVGRERERTELWRALVSTAATHEARVIFLTGAAGVGKSRLASWLCERAEELGAARALGVRATADATDPVCALVRRLTQSWQLEGDDLERHLRSWLVADLGRRAPGLDDVAVSLRRMLDESRTGSTVCDLQVVCDLLVGLARTRPTVLWVEDLQRSASAVRLVAALLSPRTAPRSRTLIVAPLTRDRSVAPAVERALRMLRDHPASHDLPIGPLPRSEHAELVDRLLGLSPELASLVVERTVGYPGAAVELVGSWLRCGALTSDLRTLGAVRELQRARLRRTE